MAAYVEQYPMCGAYGKWGLTSRCDVVPRVEQAPFVCADPNVTWQLQRAVRAL